MVAFFPSGALRMREWGALRTVDQSAPEGGREGSGPGSGVLWTFHMLEAQALGEASACRAAMRRRATYVLRVPQAAQGGRRRLAFIASERIKRTMLGLDRHVSGTRAAMLSCPRSLARVLLLPTDSRPLSFQVFETIPLCEPPLRRCVFPLSVRHCTSRPQVVVLDVAPVAPFTHAPRAPPRHDHKSLKAPRTQTGTGALLTGGERSAKNERGCNA